MVGKGEEETNSVHEINFPTSSSVRPPAPDGSLAGGPLGVGNPIRNHMNGDSDEALARSDAFQCIFPDVYFVY